jgi:ketosteroid isomerase-like protein
MINFKAFFLLTVLFCIDNYVIGQSKNNDGIKNKIELINKQISQAFIDKKIEIIISYFERDAICMPEFQSTMKGTDAIKEYYTAILNRRQINSYNKTVSETIQLKNNIAEVGTFSIKYKTNDGQNSNLKGKYLNIWTLQKNGTLKLKAESFGYFHNIDNPTLHVVKLSKESSDYTFVEPTQNNSSLAFQLKALNTLMEKSVQTRNGNLRADFFTDDAVFMPYADSSKIGMKSIRAHLIAYNSYPVSIDTINIYNVYFEDCSNFVIEYPRFYVKWHTSDSSGVGSGKGIRIWRRENDCSLKLYREIGIHDYME